MTRRQLPAKKKTIFFLTSARDYPPKNRFIHSKIKSLHLVHQSVTDPCKFFKICRHIGDDRKNAPIHSIFNSVDRLHTCISKRQVNRRIEK